MDWPATIRACARAPLRAQLFGLAALLIVQLPRILFALALMGGAWAASPQVAQALAQLLAAL